MGWFHSHNQNFDVENEAHRKIDDYLYTEHPDYQLKLFIVWEMKNDNRVNMLKIWFRIKNNKAIMLFLMLFQIIDRISSFWYPISILYHSCLHGR